METLHKATSDIEIVTGVGKKTGRKWYGIRLTIGNFTGLVFPRPHQWESIGKDLGIDINTEAK